ncbi:MAG: TonB-dependent receptor plug domain-containing protein [Candidatus Margulisiibacteriota bacterium]
MRVDVVFKQVLLAVVCMCWSGLVMAQTEPSIALPETVVSATKFPRLSSQVAEDVFVITSKNMEAAGVKNIKQALMLVPGLTVSDTGGATPTTLFLHGFQSYQILVLKDGMPINDTISPQPIAYLDSLSIDDIDRVEVMFNSKSVLYGSQAMAGVIQIFSNTDANQVHYVQGWDHGKTSAQLSRQFGSAKVSFSGSYENDWRQSSYINTSERDRKERSTFSAYVENDFGFFKGAFRYNKNKATLGLDRADYVYVGPGYAEVRIDDTNDNLQTEQNLTSLSLETSVIPLTTTVLQGSISNITRLELNQADEALNSNVVSQFWGVTRRLELRNETLLSSEWAATYGFDLQIEEGSSDYWHPLYPSSFPAQSQESQGYFGQLQYTTPGFGVSAGHRVHMDHTQHILKAYSLGSYYRVEALDLLVKPSIGTSFREAGLFERFDSYTGNPDFQPETTLSKDLLLEKPLGPVVLSWRWFENQTSNLITYDDLNTFKYIQNTGTAIATGQDYALSIRNLGPLQFLKASYTRLSAKDKTILKTPDWQANLNGGFVFDAWRYGFDAAWVGSRLDSASKPLDAYFQLNLRGAYQWGPQTQLEVILFNALNSHHQEVYGFNSHERNVYFGIKQQF